MVYTLFNLDKEPKTIIEVGTHYGTEAIALKRKYPKSRVITYEADTEKHKRIIDNFKRNNSDITFKTIGLGIEETTKTFYKFTGYENDGADSLYPRWNGQMKPAHKVKITTLEKELKHENIDKVDLLCMDTQGSELSILKGLKNRLNDISNIILEIPSVKCDTTYFKIPKGLDSVYNGAGSSQEIVEYLESFGFVEMDRRKENDLEDNVLFTKVNRHKFDCVLTAVNNNSLYLQYIPNFIKSWSILFPEIEIKIIMIEKEIPKEYEIYSKYITLFEPIQGLDTAYIAQNIRLYYPSIINKTGVLITDIDIYPLNRKYFENHINHKLLESTFISYRPKGCVGADQIAMCYNIASSRIWTKINECTNIDDVKKKLIVNYPNNYGVYRPSPLDWLKWGWFEDQEILYKMVIKSNVNIKFIGDKDFNRIDKLNQSIEKIAVLQPKIKRGDYSDFIPLRPDQENFDVINNMVVNSI